MATNMLKKAAITLAIVLGASTSALADGVIVTGTAGNDTLSGTSVAESLYGREGNDVINASGGDDELDGGPGADTLGGGDGVDAVVYSGTAPVSASIDGAANDGAAGEGDRIGLDVEDLYGAAGADRLDGKAGPDTLIGGPGDDVIDAQDNEIDQVDCGEGRDTVTADLDDVVVGCENILRPRLTVEPGLTIRTDTRRLIISNLQDGTALTIACVKGCKGKVYDRAPAPVKGGQIKLKLPTKIRRSTIEIAALAPEFGPRCVRYDIARNYRPKADRKSACSTVTKTP